MKKEYERERGAKFEPQVCNNYQRPSRRRSPVLAPGAVTRRKRITYSARAALLLLLMLGRVVSIAGLSGAGLRLGLSRTGVLKQTTGTPRRPEPTNISTLAYTHRAITTFVPVNVLVADDSDVIRKAIRRFLEGRPEVLIIGEAANCPETIAQVNQLLPDVIVLDLHMVDFHNPAIGFNKGLAGAKIVAITLGIDNVASALAESIGVDKLIDKSDLVAELVPAILELASTKTA